jgi:hypothetical protein
LSIPTISEPADVIGPVLPAPCRTAKECSSFGGATVTEIRPR